ncbi:MAG: hypothetical protein RIM84_07830 [Alphaproteobacteria bacterium]
MTIADLTGRLDTLEARCIRCGKAKSLAVARLRQLYPPGLGLPDLRRIMTRRCERAELRDQDRCDVVFGQLGAMQR